MKLRGPEAQPAQGQRPARARGAAAEGRPRPASRAEQALSAAYGQEFIVDLQRRRDQLVARVAELQWDLGGLAYEMAIRNSIKVEVLVKRAAELQDADAELSEVERILRMEETGTAGSCPPAAPPTPAAPPSAGSAASRCSAGLGRRDPAPLTARRRPLSRSGR